MIDLIKKYVDEDWQNMTESTKKYLISEHHKRYNELLEMLNTLPKDMKVTRITKVENLFHFGQFFLRGQLLLHNSSKTYYKVRRMLLIESSEKSKAITYNLDPRRIRILTQTTHTKLHFYKKLPTITQKCLIIVVQVITDSPDDEVIKTNNFLEHYIEYIIKVE